MANLNSSHKTISQFFSETSKFLIPDYQRPYEWGDSQCAALWDDLVAFAIPDEDCDNFDEEGDMYFLGPIVSFPNEKKLEIIDGQQRITTLTLLLRVFYDCLSSMKNNKDVSKLAYKIEECVWKGGDASAGKLKIESQVATDNDIDEFLDVMQTGSAKKEYNSRYAKAFRFFQRAAEEFRTKYPAYIIPLFKRVLDHCFLLSFEADSQETALRIFSTLNDRGLSLSDSDIFKAQLYKFFSQQGKKDYFIAKWKELDSICVKNFHRINGTPLDELFTRYMYYLRAKMEIKKTTTEALRRFYEKDNYAILKSEKTFDDLIALAYFWDDVGRQNSERFSRNALKRLFVLHYAPNSIWTFLTSVYFIHNKDGEGMLDDKDFCAFLDTTIAFIWACTVVSPGLNSLRYALYPEMINIVCGRPITFAKHKFAKDELRNRINDFDYLNNKPITQAMLAWWAFQREDQALLPIETTLQIEHIYAKSRYEKEHSLSNPKLIELLGNKAFLERRINIDASDYQFAEKSKYYLGKHVHKNGERYEGTQNAELLELAKRDDFKEEEIIARNKEIVESFLDFVLINGLIK